MAPSTIPDVRSHAYYILDESDSAVLAARNEHTAVPIASITKLMTALVVLEAGQSMDQVVTITADDVRGTAGNGSRLAAGYKLSRQDLLHLALMSSENRAAYALCRSYPRGLRACVQAMNTKAAALGMSTAHFVEPTGLSSRNVASPEDLAKLVLAAAGNRTISEYSTSARHTVTVNRRPARVPQYQPAGRQSGLAGRRAEDRLHPGGRTLSGDADRHRWPPGRDGPAQFLRQVHADRGRQAGPDLA